MRFGLFMLLWNLMGLILWPFILLIPQARRHWLDVPIPAPGRCWIHGASLGEHRIVNALRPHLGPCWVTSSSWRTHVPYAFPAPLDLPFSIGPWLDRARPSRLILVEAELWPGWITACKKRGIPITLIAPRKGKGYRRWQRIRSVFQHLMTDIQVFDEDQWSDLKALKAEGIASIELPPKTLVGASTRKGDDELLYHAWSELLNRPPLLILAPRYPKRVDAVMKLCEAHGPKKWSQVDRVPSSGILVIDTQGELEHFIPEAHTVFIGGTQDPNIGGHSPTSAFMAGAHILAGPHRNANPTAWNRVKFHAPSAGESWTDVMSRVLDSSRGRPIEVSICPQSIIHQLPCGAIVPEKPHRPWLRWLTPIWSILSAASRAAQKPRDLPRPTIVVGGLVAGGAGRTPVAGWLAEALGAVVISAGYKRLGAGSDVRLGTSDENLGDELEMLRRRGQPVVSAPDRIEGMSQTAPNSTIIIDGAFGDRRLQKAYRIAVIDALRPTSGGLIPMGSQRLDWHELDGADAIWFTHCTPDTPLPDVPAGRPIVRSVLSPSEWLHRGQNKPLSALTGEVDVAVGIAKPERFVCTLMDMGLSVRSLIRVRDHGEFGELKPGTVMTEKDAARLPETADVWALKMNLQAEGTEALLTDIKTRCL
jgi:tetraacyldisaccharide 4'-kinase